MPKRDAERRDQRREHHDRRVDLEHAAEHQQEPVEREQEDPLRVDVGLHPGQQRVGDLRVDQVAGQAEGDAEQDHHRADQRRRRGPAPAAARARVHVAVDDQLDDDARRRAPSAADSTTVAKPLDGTRRARAPAARGPTWPPRARAAPRARSNGWLRRLAAMPTADAVGGDEHHDQEQPGTRPPM